MRATDATPLGTPAALLAAYGFDGGDSPRGTARPPYVDVLRFPVEPLMRLDYDNTPFSPGDDSVRVIRFQSGEDGFVVPRNSDMGGSSRFDDWGDPFTGNGFTKAGDDVVPEFQTQGPIQMLSLIHI